MWQGWANEFVNIFGKMNGPDFRPARKAKRRSRASSAAVSSVVEK